MRLDQRVRNLANAVNLSTPLGLLLAAVGGGKLRRHDSVLVADNVELPLVKASAMTVGSVVLVMEATLSEAEQRFPEMMQHEEDHAWQWAYCAGLPFLPLYALASGWSMLRTGNRAAANFFEVQANLKRGGYREYPKRPVSEGVKQTWAALRGKAE